MVRWPGLQHEALMRPVAAVVVERPLVRLDHRHAQLHRLAKVRVRVRVRVEGRNALGVLGGASERLQGCAVGDRAAVALRCSPEGSHAQARGRLELQVVS
eukprot:scaffold75764_cov63-Phaeocystis_antarctica.AAC.3